MGNKGINILISDSSGDLSVINSIKNQSLDKSLFDVIIYTSKTVSEDFKDKLDCIISENPSLNITWADYTVKINPTREYIMLSREYDSFSPEYLEEIYKKARKGLVIISQRNQNDHASPLTTSKYSKPHANKGYFKNVLKLASPGSGILVPAPMSKGLTIIPGREDLFMWEILSKYQPQVQMFKKDNTNYFPGKKSTEKKNNPQEIINILSKLDHILENLKNPHKPGLIRKVNYDHEIQFVKKMMKEEASKLNNFLSEQPQDNLKIRERIKKAGLKNFPYPTLNKGLARDLVISYCFPPYVDTSGNNMAKRIREHGKVADVVQCDLTGMRNVDHHLDVISEEYLEDQMIIPAEPSFGGWKQINEFINKGMDKLNLQVAEKGVYKNIYSRAMFPASHLLAFEYKIKYPATKWTAEFSDPMIYDIKSKKRVVEIDDLSYLEKVKEAVERRGGPAYSGSNLFFLAEYLPYLFADKLIFTNLNQKKYMAKNFPIKEMKNLIEEKAVICQHSTLPDEFYHLYQSKYPLDSGYVNLAYFGSFYQTRNLDELFTALKNLKKEYKDKYRLHIFTSEVKIVKKQLSPYKLKGKVIINPYKSYLEFLNLTSRFHCLIVNDAHTLTYKDINPYLPSKYSDYLGSGTPIWSICENGSTLSQLPSEFKSTLGDSDSCQQVVQEIIEEYAI